MTSILLMLAILIVTVILAVENATLVTLNIFTWQLEASLAVIIALCFASGAIGALLAMLPRLHRARTEERRLRARLAEIDPTEPADRIGHSAKEIPSTAAAPLR